MTLVKEGNLDLEEGDLAVSRIILLRMKNINHNLKLVETLTTITNCKVITVARSW
jgi:hypothetical protein